MQPSRGEFPTFLHGRTPAEDPKHVSLFMALTSRWCHALKVTTTKKTITEIKVNHRVTAWFMTEK